MEHYRNPNGLSSRFISESFNESLSENEGESN
jgi:hypothetical protein